MQNTDTSKVPGIEWIARLAERARNYINFSREKRVLILKSYATALISTKFERGFHRVADAFAIFAEKIELGHHEMIKKVDDEMLKQELEKEGEKRKKEASEELKRADKTNNN